MQVNTRQVERKRENEHLSDMAYHPGWGVVRGMARDLETSLLNLCLLEANSEWDAIKKDGMLRAVSTLRTLVSQVEGRANDYRVLRGRDVPLDK